MLALIGQVILSLSIIVVLHELGHFLPAKFFKTKVEKFYLFFNPGFSLFKKKIGETEYGIGWLPLGGYVKIAGMIDESMDSEQMKQPAKPWEFRSKPAWQRLIIMSGGVIINYILGSLIFAGISMYFGLNFLPLSEANKYGIYASEVAQEYGFRDGDKLVSLQGEVPEYFSTSDIKKAILFSDTSAVEVERDGKTVELSFTDEQKGKLMNFQGKFIRVNLPFIIHEVVKSESTSAAMRLGLKEGDQIISFNNKHIEYNQFSDLARRNIDKEINLEYIRQGDTLRRSVVLDSTAMLGVRAKGDTTFLKFAKVQYGLGEAIPYGFKRGIQTISEQIQGFKLLFSGVGSVKDSMMGPLGIFALFPQTWDWEALWYLTAFLSLVIGFVNLLPIPGLDGGYMLLTVIEMLTGKKPSDQVMERIVFVGFVLLMSLFLFVTCNDIVKFFQ